MAFFGENETDLSDFGLNSGEMILQKAMTAGYGTDAATFEGGRALQREDLEVTLTNVLTVNKKDLKLFNTIDRPVATSTEYGYNVRTDVGDDEFNWHSEGEEVLGSEQKIERKIASTKYLSTIGAVSLQMEQVSGVADAYNEEKIAATLRLARNAERGFFHGNSAIIEQQFDGLLKQITDSANADVDEDHKATVVDLRGYEVGEDVEAADKGKVITDFDLFNSIASTVVNKGGDLTKAFYPASLSYQFTNLYKPLLRLNPKDSILGIAGGLPDIVTSINSTIKIAGDDAGADKMFRTKGKVSAKGKAGLRPNKPSSVELTVNNSATRGESLFMDKDAGDYTYVVHAINKKGISEGTAASAAASVAAGKSVTITITPDTNGAAPDGFIITRSAKDGSVVMEMVTIPAAKSGTTQYEDLNDELPGTGSIVLLSDYTGDMKQKLSFAQLMPLTTIPLPRDKSLGLPFGVVLFGTLVNRAPSFDALIKNVGYQGGLY